MVLAHPGWRQSPFQMPNPSSPPSVLANNGLVLCCFAGRALPLAQSQTCIARSNVFTWPVGDISSVGSSALACNWSLSALNSRSPGIAQARACSRSSGKFSAGGVAPASELSARCTQVIACRQQPSGAVLPNPRVVGTATGTLPGLRVGIVRPRGCLASVGPSSNVRRSQQSEIGLAGEQHSNPSSPHREVRSNHLPEQTCRSTTGRLAGDCQLPSRPSIWLEHSLGRLCHHDGWQSCRSAMWQIWATGYALDSGNTWSSRWGAPFTAGWAPPSARANFSRSVQTSAAPPFHGRRRPNPSLERDRHRHGTWPAKRGVCHHRLRGPSAIPASALSSNVRPRGHSAGHVLQLRRPTSAQGKCLLRCTGLPSPPPVSPLAACLLHGHSAAPGFGCCRGHACLVRATTPPVLRSTVGRYT